MPCEGAESSGCPVNWNAVDGVILVLRGSAKGSNVVLGPLSKIRSFLFSGGLRIADCLCFVKRVVS